MLRAAGKTVTPLALRLENEIPLGMGCGSSAAALLAGWRWRIILASWVWVMRGLWRRRAGGRASGQCGGLLVWRVYGLGADWASAWRRRRLRVMLRGGCCWCCRRRALATKKARALLPESYSKADAVFNVQRAALLAAAFAQGRLDLLRDGDAGPVHQPYRMEACPLLKALLPMSGEAGVAGVALSGAGPSVLMVLEDGADAAEVRET